MGLRQRSSLRLVAAALCLAAWFVAARSSSAQTIAAQPDPSPAPIHVTPQLGAEIFSSHGCAFCHGPQLAGTERAPKILDVRKRLNAGQIAKQIHDGGKNMPAFGEQLSPDEINALVAFLRNKHPEKLIAAAQAPATR